MKKKIRIKAKKKSPAPSLSDSVILRPNESVIYRVEAGFSIAILGLENQNIYKVHGAAAYLWLLLDGSRTLKEAIAKCQKDLAIKSPSFTSLAYQFVESVFLNGLVSAVRSKTGGLLIDSKLKAALKRTSSKAVLKLDLTQQTMSAAAASTAGVCSICFS